MKVSGTGQWPALRDRGSTFLFIALLRLDLQAHTQKRRKLETEHLSEKQDNSDLSSKRGPENESKARSRGPKEHQEKLVSPLSQAAEGMGKIS